MKLTLDQYLRPEFSFETATHLRGLSPTLAGFRVSVDGQRHYAAVYCNHPTEKEKKVVLAFIIGKAHEDLLAQKPRSWRIRRAETIVRLMMKRLAREVQQLAARKP